MRRVAVTELKNKLSEPCTADVAEAVVEERGDR